MAQADGVWALDSSGNIFHAGKSGAAWTFSQVPGSLDLIQVGPGYQEGCHPYEVWGLNTSSQIYRYNFCTSNFDQEPGSLCDIHVGGAGIWGADCGPDVFSFNFYTGSFDLIHSQFESSTELAVGPNTVWAINTSHYEAYARGDLDEGWFATPQGTGMYQIQAGGNGVWGLCGSGEIYRWEPTIQSTVQVPGALVSLSVGSGGGVWGIDSSHNVFRFTTP